MTLTRPIRFFHRQRIVEIADAPATRSVLDWLREDEQAVGTKEGCAEGDCGACTVVVGELGDDGRLKLETVNACIRFLSTLDGRALFTVEDLAPGGLLHPVQQALVEHHGSQCGFCTPGFVMSLWAAYERHQDAGTRPTRQQLADELAGNLCRCTGYRPILDAGLAMFDAPALRLDSAPVVAALQSLRAQPALHTASGFHAPRSVDELAALHEARPGARLLGGGTDIGLWVNKQLRVLPELIWTGEVAELRRVERRGDALVIGAAASLEDAWAALAAQHPQLTELWRRFASPPVRHAGTMGGNVANGSPIGDSAPVLLVLDARLVLRRGERVRELALDQFYVDYMKNRLEAGEFVQAIVVPQAPPGSIVRGWKISKRWDSDISAVCAAFRLRLDADGRVAELRIAFGGMAATVKRAAAAEAALAGRRWDEAALRAAQAALEADYQPLSDLRASAGYRLQVAKNLLERLWLETRPDAPLPAAALELRA
ncbi:xanthine dehydrogenase small subunit [Rubrivivax gelatinosus]|uniref:xanthine dehydrogenase small subunit n=1 Tax=Rubrivivax gelatinosus TaxID=28068 RepID=UPI001907BC85|nr:xanthine dehydrogenase small subunit [Rubrivivax gelatinosus]MBK1612290.1 xanthine dehydrogenase small subunit [Rubrivivax gelatinosus]